MAFLWGGDRRVRLPSGDTKEIEAPSFRAAGISMSFGFGPTASTLLARILPQCPSADLDSNDCCIAPSLTRCTMLFIEGAAEQYRSHCAGQHPPLRFDLDSKTC